MAKGGAPGQGKAARKVGKVSSAPALGVAQLRAGPGLSRSRVSTKATTSGGGRSPKSLPRGNGGKK